MTHMDTEKSQLEKRSKNIFFKFRFLKKIIKSVTAPKGGGGFDFSVFSTRVIAFGLLAVPVFLIFFFSFPEDASAFFGWIEESMMGFVAWLAYAVLALTSLFVVLAGVFFEYAATATVLNLSTNINLLGGGIDAAWSILRDLANIVFIFVLLYVSIATILRLGSVNTKKMLKNVIVIALLINFSMFFTHVVIDFTNAFAIAFYNVTRHQAEHSAGGTVLPQGNIAAAFLTAGALTSIYDAGDGAEKLQKIAGGEIGGLLGLAAVGSIFYIVLSFILIAAAILLVLRFVMFILLIILSPLAFISVIIPQTAGMFQRWFGSLTNNALFAPIFMMLLWASVALLNAVVGTNMIDTGGTNLASLSGEYNPATGASSLPIGAGPVIFQTVIAMGFLAASLVIAKSLSLQGGSWVSSTGTKYGRALAVGATAGLAARGGRRFIGGSSQKMLDSEYGDSLREKAARGSKIAQMQLATLEKTSGAGFGYNKTKGGYKKMQENKFAREKSRMKSLAPSQATIAKAEEKLELAKKSGNSNNIMLAQQKVDNLKGVSDNEAQSRKKGLREEAEKNMKTSIRTITPGEKRERNKVLNSYKKDLSNAQTQKEKAQARAKYQEHLNEIKSRHEKAQLDQTIENLATTRGLATKETKSVGRERQEEFIKNKKGRVFKRRKLRKDLEAELSKDRSTQLSEQLDALLNR